MQNISLIGSSGSIGSQVKQIVRRYPEKFRIVAMTVNSSVQSLESDVLEFKPLMVGVSDTTTDITELKKVCKNTELYTGQAVNEIAASLSETQTVVISVVGMCGLKSVVAALNNGKRVALANKESLVTGGCLVTEAAKANKTEIFPIDSEHSAIFQCLHAGRKQELKRIILTASGGPFREYSLDQMQSITIEQALKHPTWSMGKKITIDSATLMNKGLEVIEARWLFDTENIDYVIHPQSIIHSMVEFKDNSVIAQMSYPTMEIPIQLALTYPERFETAVQPVDFDKLKELTFEKVDLVKFPCLKLAVQAMKSGGFYPAILNGANECAVNLFLNRKISFLQIAEIIENALTANYPSIELTVDNIYCLDETVKQSINSIYKA